MAARIASGKPTGGHGGEGAAASTQQLAGATAAGLRPVLRARRAAMPAAMRARADAKIRELLARELEARLADEDEPQVLAAFWPIGEEPDLRPLMARWDGDARLRLALPVVRKRGAPLVFREWTARTPMAPGAYGIPEPQGGGELAPRIVLAPLLGFTEERDRIGYGGGFYDRTLAALKAAGGPLWTVGVAHACLRLAPGEHAPEPHDVRLDAIVTEDGWIPALA